MFRTAYDPAEREVRQSNGDIWRGFFVETYAPQNRRFWPTEACFQSIRNLRST